MKKVLSILGAVLFSAGFMIATGIEKNPVQAIYALILMGAACVCFNRADAISKRTSNKPGRKVYDYQRGIMVDAA